VAEYPLGTAARMIRVAKDEIGVAETGDNLVKYNNENGLAWCGYFIDWCAKRAGIKKLPSQISTIQGANKMKEFGCWVDDVPKPGDLVYMGFGGKNSIEHIGLVVGIIDKKQVLTIEGNTSGSGSQANGGQVMVKVRTIGKEIIGFARPKYLAFSGEYPTVEIPSTGILKGKKK
jgi:hypothetical protein